MNASSPNIELEYLYRDAGNNKSYGTVVFSNQGDLSIAEIDEALYEHFIDDNSFEVVKWGLPYLYQHPYDPEIDHDWHDYKGITPTTAEPNHGDIDDFIQRLRSFSAGLPPDSDNPDAS